MRGLTVSSRIRPWDLRDALGPPAGGVHLAPDIPGPLWNWATIMGIWTVESDKTRPYAHDHHRIHNGRTGQPTNVTRPTPSSMHGVDRARTKVASCRHARSAWQPMLGQPRSTRRVVTSHVVRPNATHLLRQDSGVSQHHSLRAGQADAIRPWGPGAQAELAAAFAAMRACTSGRRSGGSFTGGCFRDGSSDRSRAVTAAISATACSKGSLA